MARHPGEHRRTCRSRCAPVPRTSPPLDVVPDDDLRPAPRSDAGRPGARPGGADPARRDRAGARARLADTLAPITHSVWPEISHRLSLLTNTGIPVEFSWSTRHTALRWTAEVAGPGDPEGGSAGHRQQARRRRRRLARGDPGRPAPPLRRVARRAARRRDRRAEGVRRAPDRRPGARCRCATRPLDDLDLEWRIGGVAANGTVELYGRGDIDRAAIDRCERAAFGTTGELAAAVARLLGSPELPGRRCSASPSTATAGSRRSPGSGSRSGCSPGTTNRSRHSSDGVPTNRACELLRALAGGADDGRWRVGLIGARLAAAGSTSVQAAIRPS